MKKKTKILIGIIIVLLLSASVFLFYFLKFDKRVYSIREVPYQEIEDKKPQAIPKLSLVAKNLEVPWSMVFLPDKSMLFTERPGRVRLIDKDGKLQEDPVATIAEVKAINEGGLLGIEIHPKFSENKYVYFYYTFEPNKTLNRVVRYKFDGKTITEPKTIVDNIPGAAIHNGGRIKFGPDGYLYIAAGDAADPSLSQNKNQLAGKILRVTDEGEKVDNNPFDNLVYSMGHRNPQGLAWDDQDRLWVTEHGQIATDELNLVSRGANYGWPTIVGDQTKDGLEVPVAHSGDNNWAPSGAVYFKGSIYFAGLRGQALYEAKINGDKVEIKEHLKGEVGRIRDVIVGPDGYLYISTSNRDGRNVPVPDDDRIIRVNTLKL